MSEDTPRWLNAKEENVLTQLLGGPLSVNQLVTGSGGLINLKEARTLLSRMLFKGTITSVIPVLNGIQWPSVHKISPTGERVLLAHRTQAKTFPGSPVQTYSSNKLPALSRRPTNSVRRR